LSRSTESTSGASMIATPSALCRRRRKPQPALRDGAETAARNNSIRIAHARVENRLGCRRRSTPTLLTSAPASCSAATTSRRRWSEEHHQQWRVYVGKTRTHEAFEVVVQLPRTCLGHEVRRRKLQATGASATRRLHCSISSVESTFRTLLTADEVRTLLQRAVGLFA